MPMEVHDGQNRCNLGLHEEEHAERKPVENGSPKLPKDDWKMGRPFFDPRKRCAKFTKEFRPEAVLLSVVPRCRFEGIEFCLGSNLQTRHLPTGAEALLYSFNDLFPRSGFFRGSAMCGETLF